MLYSVLKKVLRMNVMKRKKNMNIEERSRDRKMDNEDSIRKKKLKTQGDGARRSGRLKKKKEKI